MYSMSGIPEVCGTDMSKSVLRQRSTTQRPKQCTTARAMFNAMVNAQSDAMLNALFIALSNAMLNALSNTTFNAMREGLDNLATRQQDMQDKKSKIHAGAKGCYEKCFALDLLYGGSATKFSSSRAFVPPAASRNLTCYTHGQKLIVSLVDLSANTSLKLGAQGLGKGWATGKHHGWLAM